MGDDRIVGTSTLILAAGMPRSASTWLYNAARLILRHSPAIERNFSCGFIDDWDQIPFQPYRLIKMHEYDAAMVARARWILYSYRDIRDAMASSCRSFGFEPTMEMADYFINQYEKWTPVATYVMRYETMLENREKVIAQVAHVLDAEGIDPCALAAELDVLRYENPGPKNEHYHRINLYHRGHITDGRHGSWKGCMDQGLLDRIVEKYRDWFTQNGYATDET